VIAKFYCHHWRKRAATVAWMSSGILKANHSWISTIRKLQTECFPNWIFINMNQFELKNTIWWVKGSSIRCITLTSLTFIIILIFYNQILTSFILTFNAYIKV
jgi:hypothetical protein